MEDEHAFPDKKGGDLSRIFLEIHAERGTGVLTVKNARLSVKIHLKDGLLVHAEGLDRETPLLNEIVQRKGLNPGELQELIRLTGKGPHALSEELIRRGLITLSFWDRFLVLRARQHLAAALQMEGADHEMSRSGPEIPSGSCVNRDLLEMLVDTIRGMKSTKFFKKVVPGPETRFQRTPDWEQMMERFPLSFTERSVLSMVGGRKTLADIAMSTGLEHANLYQVFYLLSFLGMVTPQTGEDSPDYSEIIKLYLDFLGIVESRFRNELGREFDTIFTQCVNSLSGQSAWLFEGVEFGKENKDQTIAKIRDRFSSLLDSGESRLVLATSFNKLIYPLLRRMKKILGVGLTQNALSEMMNLMGYLEKYKNDEGLMDYLSGTLKDYMEQIGS